VALLVGTVRTVAMTDVDRHVFRVANVMLVVGRTTALTDSLVMAFRLAGQDAD